MKYNQREKSGRTKKERRDDHSPITLPQMDELTLTEPHRRYKESTDAETRTR
jgi:hypothetical protein